ncbi:MAG: hypothetical protein DI622_16460, partial [Chryseobacterium sp.]
MEGNFEHIDKITGIIHKHIKGTSLDDNEMQFLNLWLRENGNRELFNKLTNEGELTDSLQVFHSTDTQEQLKIVNDRIRTNNASISPIRKWFAVAASIILALSISSWFYFKNSKLDRQKDFAFEDVMPGKNRAVLTLSSGQSINLDEIHDQIAITSDGISYKDGKVIAGSENIQYAKLQTPNGGTYAINLPDGTKVWLNAGSELEYPLHFTENTREVKLKGEGYFDVAHDKAHPFIVNTDIQRIKVLGTSFNVRAYTDKQATTLVTGKVSVNTIGNNSETKIVPGEQALVGNGKVEVSKVDVSDFTTWKDGMLAGTS